MNQVSRDLVKNYFTRRFPKWSVIVLLVGLILLTAKPLYGIILIVIAGAVMYFLYFGKRTATDEQVDECIVQDCAGAIERGRDKVGIVLEMELKEPIVIRGAHYEYVNRDTTLHFKTGKDGHLRYSLGQITVFYVTENQLYCYTRVVDYCTGNTFTETTDEYFYRDIVSVATLSEKRHLVDAKGSPLLDKRTKQPQIHDVEVFKLTTSGGTSIQATIRDKTAMTERKGIMDITKIEEQIKAMRNILREKKAV